MGTPHQMSSSVGTSHVLHPSPSFRKGSDEAIIPHRLGDEGLGCLYGTKDTSLIARRSCRDKTHWNPYGTILRAELRRQTLALARRLLRYKIHWKPCETIPRGGPTMLRIWAHLINFSILFRDYTIEME